MDDCFKTNTEWVLVEGGVGGGMEPKKQDGLVYCCECVFHHEAGWCTNSHTEVTDFQAGQTDCKKINNDGKCEFYQSNRQKEK